MKQFLIKPIGKTALLLVLFSLVTFVAAPVYAVGGISAAKLVVPTVDTVPAGAIEFEPTAEVDYGLETESILFTNSFGNRITWGVSDTFEMGINAAITTTDIAFDYGFKWNFLQFGESFGLGFMGGVGWGSGTGTNAYGAGLIFSAPLGKTLHVDFSAEAGYTRNSLSAGLNLGIGWYFVDNVQFCIEASYARVIRYGEEETYGYTGITWDVNESVILVLGQWFGRNNPQRTFTTGTFFAATILID
ncbi:MAG: hypothetical protein ABUK01_07720 [Leptospirales bacterium]